ncbi:MAG TPA: Nramp family divalent metal transporter [Fimbriimonadaceae bacterium]|nr:Nramp family divalent metal transporter [Fimbriimonadaceae bacterium]
MLTRDRVVRLRETPVPVPGRRVARSPRARSFLTFMMVMGPGLIVMEADNDAGAVQTYTQAGAQYGLHLLWVLLLLLPICYFIQEMVARLGIATGQGHAAMIYQRFGKWWGVFSLLDLQLVNFLTLVTEFAAISLALSKMGVSPYISVPSAAVGLIALVATGSYLRWERIVITLCLIDVAWFALSAIVGPRWGAAAFNAVVPSMPKGGITTSLVFLVIAIVGTTIAPWQLFFQQSCVADKKLRFADLKWARLDTFIGACFTILVAGAMMLVGDAAFRHGLKFSDPAQMASDLAGIYGPFLRNGILLLFVNAAVLGTTAISLSSAWAYGEVKQWPHSLHKSVIEAPGFYAVYALCVFAAAGVVLIPRAPLPLIILGVQVLAGLILPSAVIFLQLLLNDRELLGERFSNKPWNNYVNWTIIVLLFALSLVLAAQVVLPNLVPAT